MLIKLVVFSLIYAGSAVANPIADIFNSTTDFSQQFKPIAFVSLYSEKFPTFHPQGVKVIGQDVYLSTVEGESTGHGYLIKYRLQKKRTAATPVDRITFDAGPGDRMNHAGGFDGSSDTLYVPLAEYNSHGPGELLAVDLKNFGAYHAIATISDHIGGTVYDPVNRKFLLFDWSTGVYTVPFALLDFVHPVELNLSKQIADKTWEYQDCKNVGDGYALCSAKSGSVFVSGEIHLIKASSGTLPFQVVHRLSVPNLGPDGSPGSYRPLTYNAMDVEPILDGQKVTGLRFYFVPHDDQDSHLMVFETYSRRSRAR